MGSLYIHEYTGTSTTGTFTTWVVYTYIYIMGSLYILCVVYICYGQFIYIMGSYIYPFQVQSQHSEPLLTGTNYKQQNAT